MAVTRSGLVRHPVTLRVLVAAILVAGGILAGLMVHDFLGFLQNTKAHIHAASGPTHRGADFMHEMAWLNPRMPDFVRFNVLLTSVDGLPVFNVSTCDPWFGDLFASENATLVFNTSDCYCVQQLDNQLQHFLLKEQRIIRIINGRSFFTPDRMPSVAGPHAFVNPEHGSYLMAFNMAWGKALDRSDRLVDAVHRTFPWTRPGHGYQCPGSNRTFNAEMTSVYQAVQALEDNVLHSLARINTVALPVALVLVALATRSVRVLIVPALALPVGVVLTFATLQRWYGETHAFSPMVPELAAAIYVALTIDFTLFLASRFREAAMRRENFDRGEEGEAPTDHFSTATIGSSSARFGPSYWAAARIVGWLGGYSADDVASTMVYQIWPPVLLDLVVVMEAAIGAARNIAFSGLTIGGVFLSVALTSGSHELRRFSVGAMAAAFGACFTALYSALLLFELYPLLRGCCCCCCARFARSTKKKQSAVGDEALLSTPANDSAASLLLYTVETSANTTTTAAAAPVAKPATYLSQLRQRLSRSDELWARVALFSVHHPYAVVVASLVVVAPFGWALGAHFRVGYGLYAEIPTGSPATQLLRRLTRVEEGGVSPRAGTRLYMTFKLPFHEVLANNGQLVAASTTAPIPGYDDGWDPLYAVMDEATRRLQQRLRYSPPRAPLPAAVGSPFPYFADESCAGVAATVVSPSRAAFGTIDGPPVRSPFNNYSLSGGIPNSMWSPYGLNLLNLYAPFRVAPFSSHAVVEVVMENADAWGNAGGCVMEALHDVWSTMHAEFAGTMTWTVLSNTTSNTTNGTIAWCLVNRTYTRSLDEVFPGFYGPGGASFTVMHETYKRASVMIGAVVAVLVVGALVFFRSIFVAFRLAFTMVWTIVVSLGAVTMAFAIPHEQLNTHAGPRLQWLVPIIGSALVAGLTLDYDGFVLGRIVEERLVPGTSDQHAIVRAVTATGSVISYAGVIMSVAFGSLGLSDMVLLQQFGLMLTVAVLVDTFFVRPILVPALMCMAPRVVWWPRRMPAVVVAAADPSGGTDDDTPYVHDGRR